MTLNCPAWIYKRFTDPLNLTVYVFEDVVKRKIYAIPWLWAHDPQGLNRWYLGWYDQNGKWLYQTLANRTTVSQMNYNYLGKCETKSQCQRPFWLSDRFAPDEKYRVDLYWHQKLGAVYALHEKGLADAPTVWYVEPGRKIHVSPVYGWGTYSQDTIRRDSEWSKSVKYIGICQSVCQN